MMRAEGDDCPVLRAGHPIVCHLEGSPCQSKLRILRATAVHYPKVAQFQRSVYEDEAIHSKQYDCLMKACNIVLSLEQGTLMCAILKVVEQTTHPERLLGFVETEHRVRALQ